MSEHFDRQLKQRAFLADNGLYDPTHEHDACGVGIVVTTGATPRRDVVEKAITALESIWHRGAVDADGKTGDGAGIHLEIPISFFVERIRRIGHEPDPHSQIALGHIFLPRTNFTAQEESRTVVESQILRFGHRIYGWRQVPIDVSCLGEKAAHTRPEIEQIMICDGKGLDQEAFDRELYLIRRHIEKEITNRAIQDFYICSLSCRSVIYKGMMLAEDVSNFYPDLKDPDFVSRYAIYHQRYSTNTFPQWRLAQPFRTLAHNGEINTLRGNVNWMRSHEIRMASEDFNKDAEVMKPIIQPGNSDSGALDNVLELIVRAGRSAPMAKTLLIPESLSISADEMPQSWQDMYAYCNAVMEPWDGPAALAVTDGRFVLMGLDRSGLRPCRYVETTDGLLIAGSEIGMVPVADESVLLKGALGPGQMIAVDMKSQSLYHDQEIKDMLANSRPFGEWVGKITKLDTLITKKESENRLDLAHLLKQQIAAGYTHEVLETILLPMAQDGKEAIASMGDDSALAIFDKAYRPLSHFFRQNFSQVTNPPIDSLRESRVMSLKTRFGNLQNVLEQSSGQTEILTLDTPFLSNSEFVPLEKYFGASAAQIDCTFDRKTEDLRHALTRIRNEAVRAVRAGTQHLILTDQDFGPERAMMPMILVTSAVHTHLTQKGLRTFCSLNIRSAECVDAHYFALLIGSGATTINPYLACASLENFAQQDFSQADPDQLVRNYREAINQGLLKIMAKMGISVVSSYRGGLNFEAIGLSRALVSEFFANVPSRISGIGLRGLRKKIVTIHNEAWQKEAILPIGGFYKLRTNGTPHVWQAKNMKLLQESCKTGDYRRFQEYSTLINSAPPIHLRNLLEIKPLGAPIPLHEVESVTKIRKRFVTPAMSLGALSPEAHRALNIAMNRIGAKSDSGEGGEDPDLFKPLPNGDNASAKIKQVASGRFGVTAEYLNHAEEIEIKMAQGAKPGEGGQLPGMKVTELIARLRHSTPGVTLISPPPHHDIYSIEDLAQLIYDLKQINPRAKVTVKLVAASGVGTIAAGVAKAKADIILISGHNGGTGASPASSIKFAGIPWELGLAEAHQVLSVNDLRSRVTLRTDGGLRTGRDVIIAAMLGAEEYGVGTAALIAMGCIMVRQCHSNTCPVGVCTQDPNLREKFSDTAAENVVNLITFYAEEVREILASIGARALDEIIGRTDFLRQASRGESYLDDLDLNPMLISTMEGSCVKFDRNKPRNPVLDTLDAQILRDCEPFLEHGEKMELAYTVQNTLRSIGTRMSSHVVARFGEKNSLLEGHLTLKLRGSAGQSLGAFTCQGIRIELVGDSNDYVGKGLSGGTIIVKPHPVLREKAHLSTIIGNTVLYGATSGRLFANGRAGQRFAVRNSGATAVIEGCGDNGCEYMTGGQVAILGPIGHNFGAGMTGGVAYIYDPDMCALEHMNADSIEIVRIKSKYWETTLRNLVEAHLRETGSKQAQEILDHWKKNLDKFWQICPKEMITRLAHPLEEKTKEAQEKIA